MLEMPMRLVIAYGLIALMVLGAVAVAWWMARNNPERRARRDKARQLDYYRRRRDDAANPADR